MGIEDTTTMEMDIEMGIPVEWVLMTADIPTLLHWGRQITVQAQLMRVDCQLMTWDVMATLLPMTIFILEQRLHHHYRLQRMIDLAADQAHRKISSIITQSQLGSWDPQILTVIHTATS
jgi:hypothetical protein